MWALVCTVWNTLISQVGIRHCLVLEGFVRKFLKALTRLYALAHDKNPTCKLAVAYSAVLGSVQLANPGQRSNTPNTII